MDLFLGWHLLDSFVIDLVHGVVGQGRFADILQQRFHQHLIVLEGEMPLDVIAIANLLLVGRLRQNNDIREISDEVFALLLGRHLLRHAGADLILGQREVALMDLDAIDAGKDRIGVLRLDNGRCDEERRERECTERAAERTGGSHERDPLTKLRFAGLVMVYRTHPVCDPGSADTRRNPSALAMANPGAWTGVCRISLIALTKIRPPPISRPDMAAVSRLVEARITPHFPSVGSCRRQKRRKHDHIIGTGFRHDYAPSSRSPGKPEI